MSFKKDADKLFARKDLEQAKLAREILGMKDGMQESNLALGQLIDDVYSTPLSPDFPEKLRQLKQEEIINFLFNNAWDKKAFPIFHLSLMDLLVLIRNPSDVPEYEDDAFLRFIFAVQSFLFDNSNFVNTEVLLQLVQRIRRNFQVEDDDDSKAGKYYADIKKNEKILKEVKNEPGIKSLLKRLGRRNR